MNTKEIGSGKIDSGKNLSKLPRQQKWIITFFGVSAIHDQ